MTTPRQGQNSRNEFLSQGYRICLWVGRKLEEKLVTISNICHKVVVIISDIYCIVKEYKNYSSSKLKIYWFEFLDFYSFLENCSSCSRAFREILVNIYSILKFTYDRTLSTFFMWFSGFSRSRSRARNVRNQVKLDVAWTRIIFFRHCRRFQIQFCKRKSIPWVPWQDHIQNERLIWCPK